LVELRVVAVNAVWIGADTFIEIEAWAKAKLDWLRRYLKLEHGIPSHWAIENRLHGCLDVAFADDPMRERTGHAAYTLAVLKQITLNLIRLDPTRRNGSIRTRRLIAASSDTYRNQLLGMI
jgi:hypothetical protein